MNITKSRYKRPLVTKTERITDEQITDKLEDYIQIKKSNLKDVSIGTHLRYFTITKDGEKIYRPGGFLVNNTGLPKYIYLTNNKLKWPVQIKTSVFFKKMSVTEVKEEYDDYIDQLEHKLKKYKKKIMQQDKEIKELRKMLD